MAPTCYCWLSPTSETKRTDMAPPSPTLTHINGSSLCVWKQPVSRKLVNQLHQSWFIHIIHRSRGALHLWLKDLGRSPRSITKGNWRRIVCVRHRHLWGRKPCVHLQQPAAGASSWRQTRGRGGGSGGFQYIFLVFFFWNSLEFHCVLISAIQ